MFGRGGGDADDDDDCDTDGSEGEMPLDAQERDAVRATRRRATRRVLERVQREYALAVESLRADLDAARRDAVAARADLDAARRDLARERADRAWAGACAAVDAGADYGLAPAVARYIADVQARCVYAEVCCELRWHAHAAESARMRADAERDAAQYATHLAACRREVADLRARADTAAELGALRAEAARLGPATAEARATLAALRGEIGAALGPGGVERLRSAVRDQLRADMAAEIRADVMRAVAESRARAATDVERMRRDAHAAHEALVRYRAEGARLVASLEGVARDKCASEITRVRRDLARFIGPHWRRLVAAGEGAAHGDASAQRLPPPS